MIYDGSCAKLKSRAAVAEFEAVHIFDEFTGKAETRQRICRGILVVFAAPGRSNVHVWSLIVMCEPRRPGLLGPLGLAHDNQRSPNVHILGQPSAGPPKISRFFFPPPAAKFVLFFPFWGSSRGILVVFLKTGALKCARLGSRAVV